MSRRRRACHGHVRASCGSHRRGHDRLGRHRAPTLPLGQLGASALQPGTTRGMGVLSPAEGRGIGYGVRNGPNMPGSGGTQRRPLLTSGKPRCDVDSVGKGLSSSLQVRSMRLNSGRRRMMRASTAALRSGRIARMEDVRGAMIVGDGTPEKENLLMSKKTNHLIARLCPFGSERKGRIR